MLLIRTTAALLLFIGILLGFKSAASIVTNHALPAAVIHTCRDTFEPKPLVPAAPAGLDEACMPLVREVFAFARKVRSAYIALFVGAVLLILGGCGLLFASRKLHGPAP